MNLINTPWIPVRRQKSRQTEYICPWQLTEGHEDNPIVAIDFPRPDLSSGVVVFLIGLFQLAMTPGSDRAWHRKYEIPPSADDLKAALGQFSDHFKIDGDGARCFQDLELAGEDPRPIGSLLIDEPGGQTLRRNTDLFIKREQFPGLGLSATVAALITMQSSAPAGGKGHRTSMRGGGPLNTLLVPDPRNDELSPSLWRTIWLNVLNRSEVETLSGNTQLTEPEYTLPWLVPARTSEPKSGKDTFPEHAHPLQMFFAMPRRIRLNLEDLQIRPCPLTLREEPLVETFQTRSYGVNYQGAWQHPLSPHRYDKDGFPIPLHPQPGGIGYRHWLHLTLGSPAGAKEKVQAAAVVRAAQNQWKDKRKTLVWSFGFDMDNMKARGWYESTMPVLHLDADSNELLAARAHALIDSALQVSANLRQAVRKAWFSDGATVSGDLSFITQGFWQQTEVAFFDHLNRDYAALKQGSAKPDRRGWLNHLNSESLRLFDHFAANGNIAFENPKRIAVARRDLVKFNHKKSIKDGLRIRSQAA
ncbi:MAG: type I-E CRISPR-associated protein Cse1/CasA [Wenzhouxiangella sp.]|nr:MAG: type I-E CRISPR-associated protein Cse1/CasA [Wenzhouxiangella sp.]